MPLSNEELEAWIDFKEEHFFEDSSAKLIVIFNFFFELRANDFATVKLSRPNLTFDKRMAETVADVYEAFGFSEALAKKVIAKTLESFELETKT